MQGIFIAGECLGCKTNDRTFTDKVTGLPTVYHDVKLGLRVPKPDGFEDETEVITVTLAKKHIEAQLPNLFSSLRNKMISVPVYASGFSGRNGVMIEYKLSGDGKPLED